MHTDVVFIYKYMYTYWGLYLCVYVCTPTHMCIQRRCMCRQSVYIQMHTCTRICVGAWVRMYECVDLLVCVWVYVYIHLHQVYNCVRRVYVYVYIYLHTCTRVRIHTEFSCMILNMFTYVDHHPVEV